MNRPRIVFFGTPEFAVPALEALAGTRGEGSSGSFRPLAVFTQPDRPSGRGQKLSPPPIKIRAQELEIPVAQPTTLRGITLTNGVLSSDREECAELVRQLNALAPIDLAVVIAYGKIIPKALLEFPKFGCLNIHGSILPRWRGAAPIHRALMAGDQETGVALMKLEEGLDTGPVYVEQSIPIRDSDTLSTLHDSLAKLGADLLIRSLPDILDGKCQPIPQATDGVTYAAKWEKDESRIDWSEPSTVCWRRVRATFSGASTSFEGDAVKICSATPGSPVNVSSQANVGSHAGVASAAPGAIVAVSPSGLTVACGEGVLTITELQFPGKKRVPVAEVMKSRNFSLGQKFQ